MCRYSALLIQLLQLLDQLQIALRYLHVRANLLLAGALDRDLQDRALRQVLPHHLRKKSRELRVISFIIADGFIIGKSP